MIGGALFLAALVALQPPPIAVPSVRPVAPLPAARILVVPFETPGRDGRTYWLGEGAALLVSDDMAARGLGVISRSARERAYDQLHLPSHEALTSATVIKIGQLLGAAQVVVGSVEVEGETLTVHARAIRLEAGRAEPEATERGPSSDLFGMMRRVARRVAPGGGDAAPGETPSPQAFEQYVKGLIAERPAAQVEFLEAAITLDRRYDAPRIALWDVRAAQGNYAAALAAVRGIAPDAPLARRGRFRAAVALVELKQYDEAFSILKSLADAQPDAAIYNELGIVQLRRGGSEETGQATYYFTKAADAEPDDTDLLFNLGYAYALDRDPQAAIYWLKEAVRRNPADADAHYVLAAELDSGTSVEAARERELARQLSAKYAERRTETLPRGLERSSPSLESRRAFGVDQALVTASQRDQKDVAQYHLERGRRLFQQERDREALAELRRAVFLSPYEAEAHLLIGRIYLRGARPREAVDALKISIWSQDSAAARVALAEAYLELKDPAAARTEVEKALAIDPASADARQLEARIRRGG